MHQLYQGELGLGIASAAGKVIDFAAATARHEQTAKRKAERVAALKAEHPELISPDATVDGLIAAAKNVRKQLRDAFPGVKFRVTTDRFSMGDALRVSWTDGPQSSRVEEIVNQYKAGSFDGMTDSYEYSGSAWGEAFGNAKYTSCNRNYSPAIEAWLAAEHLQGPERWEEQQKRRETLYSLNIKAVKTSPEGA